MIEQACDDFTGPDLAARTCIYHAFQFAFEHTKLLNAALRFDEVTPRKLICFGAIGARVLLKIDQIPNGFDRESQIACMPDKAK